MGSTFLSLTNKVLRRLNEVELTEANFASARGIHAVAKDAVVDTLRKINTQKFEWPFNKADGQQSLTIGQEEYVWPSDLKTVDWESFYIENDGVNTTETTSLKQISKEDYWRYYRNADLDAGADGIECPKYVFEASGAETSSDPVVVRGGFGVTPSPDAGYIVHYTYFVNTIDMETYDDETTVPDLYDDVILEGALAYMYSFLDNVVRSDIHKASFKMGVDDMAYILIPKTPYFSDTRVNYGGGTFSSGFYWGE